MAEEVAVFAETNLGTRIVMTVPLDITSAGFKRKLEKTHASCLGDIRVHGLMVKRKSRLYYFAESVPIKYIFRDDQKPWFIHAEARLVNRSQVPSISNSAQIGHCSVGLIHGENKKTEKSPFLGPETIIRAAELKNSECLDSFIPKTPERKTGESVSISKKLIVAANNIRMQGKCGVSSSLSSSIFRSKTRRKRSLDGKTVTSLAKFMVFEIPDTED